MTTLFLVCAVGGGVVLLCQLVMTLIGLDNDSGIDPGADIIDDPHMGDDFVHPGDASSWFFGVLSFRALTAAFTFFGLGGLAAGGYGWGTTISLLMSLVWGVGAMLIMAWLMRLLIRLHSDGTVDIWGSVGHTATVYLTIPGEKASAGKVTVTLQGRSMEYEAVTSGEALSTGAQVIIMDVVGPGKVEVAAF